MSNDFFVFLYLVYFAIYSMVSSYVHLDTTQIRSSTSIALFKLSPKSCSSNIPVVHRVDSEIGLLTSFLKSSTRDDMPQSCFELTVDSSEVKIDADDDPYMQSLNSVQRSIVAADLKNIRVQAGPGSGKTR